MRAEVPSGHTNLARICVSRSIKPVVRGGLDQMDIAVAGLVVEVPSEALSRTPREIMGVAHEFRELERARRR